MKAGGKQRRKNSAVTFMMALILKPFKSLHSWWHPVVCRMELHELIHSATNELIYLFIYLGVMFLVMKAMREHLARRMPVSWLWSGRQVLHGWVGCWESNENTSYASGTVVLTSSWAYTRVPTYMLTLKVTCVLWQIVTRMLMFLV